MADPGTLCPVCQAPRQAKRKTCGKPACAKVARSRGLERFMKRKPGTYTPGNTGRTGMGRVKE